MDLLDDILQSLRLRGTVYFRAAFRAPWGMELPRGEVANFHLVCRGECWVTSPFLSEPLQLRAGDVVICPRGDQHSLRYAPDANVVPAKELINTPKPDPDESIAFGGDGTTTTSLICGHYEYNRSAAHPLFESLPPVVLIPAKSGDAAAARTVGDLASAMSGSNAVSNSVAVDRLAEALLIHCMTNYVEQEPDAASFIAAAQDKHIGRAIALIHQDIAREWSVSELAREAAMSRSVFSERFRNLVGVPPMVYIARWRMLKARNYLAETSLSVAQVSQEVGYRSEFAFAKAFKKVLGITPGAARKAGAA